MPRKPKKRHASRNITVNGTKTSLPCLLNGAWIGNCLRRVSNHTIISLIGTRRTTMKHRISLRLEKHKEKLRKRALKEENEEKRRDYWLLYFDAKDIEPEIREMILKAEKHTLLEMIVETGLVHILLDDEKSIPPPPADDEPKPSDDGEPPDHDDDIP